MIRWRMAAAAAVASLAALAMPAHAQVLRQAPQQAPEAAAPQTSSAVVSANRSWTPTGATVRAGGRVQISAQGRWTLGAATVAAALASGPDGVPGRTNPNAHLPNANVGALVGRIGDAGKPFLVGSSYAATASADGELFLAINDGARDAVDNTGRVSASIIVSPPPQVVRPTITATAPRVTAPVQTTRPQIAIPPPTRLPPTQTTPSTPTQTTPPTRTPPTQSTTPPSTRAPVDPPPQTAPPQRTPPATTPPPTMRPPTTTRPPPTQPPTARPPSTQPPATQPPAAPPPSRDPPVVVRPPVEEIPADPAPPPVVETPPELVEPAPLPTDVQAPPPVAPPETPAVAPDAPVQPATPTNWLMPVLAAAAGLLVLAVLFGFRPGARKPGGDAEKSSASAPRITSRVAADGRAGESLSVNWRGRS